jgi:hypothetical protein
VNGRRQALLGFLTYRLVRRLAKRRLSGAFGAGRPGDADGGQRMKQAKNARAAAASAVALVETVRPFVSRAMNDPELHDALRQAFSTGMDVRDELSGKPPKKAAKKIARDKKLQKKVENSAQDLQKAVSNLVEKPKKGRVRRLVGRVAIVGAVAGGVVVALRKLKGRGGEDTPY